MRITATFLDEITWDIPHQNWGPAEWDRDFGTMKKMGINTVVLVRSGLARWLAYPSEYLNRECGCAIPDLDLIDLFLSGRAQGRGRHRGVSGRPHRYFRAGDLLEDQPGAV